ncbi:MAG: class I SAM-dependent methyltransferase [Pirellulales bacterium]|nr:class I SAM-dependent methyltransferase [Pirellulales bacterium]
MTPVTTHAYNHVEFTELIQALGSASPRRLRRYRWRARLCPFDRLLESVPIEASMLDIGCGDGLLLGLLATRSHRFQGVGLEQSAQRVAQANAMAESLLGEANNARLRFVQADVPQDLPPGQFDVVSLIDVLHHVPPKQQSRILAQACAAVRPGGQLIYKDMCIRPRWRSWANRLHDLVLSRQWIRYFPVDRVERLANRCGLALTATARIDRYWYGHELRVFVKRASSELPLPARSDRGTSAQAEVATSR